MIYVKIENISETSVLLHKLYKPNSGDFIGASILTLLLDAENIVYIKWSASNDDVFKKRFYKIQRMPDFSGSNHSFSSKFREITNNMVK